MTELERWLAANLPLRELLDRLPDLVFFIKDTEGRYRAVNRTLVRRLGRREAGELLGRTTRELFPAPLGERYLEQDLLVCSSGQPLEDLLELHLYPNRDEGWCLTDKRPLSDDGGRVIGLVGTSRDLHAPAADASLGELAVVLQQVHERFAEPLRVEQLAASAGLSPFRLNRRLRALFGLTAAQLIATARIDAARRLLRGGAEPIAHIALACGYCDQSAFTRHFKATVGLTPAQYRDRG
jgi:AraC-like DNA-binding protein